MSNNSNPTCLEVNNLKSENIAPWQQIVSACAGACLTSLCMTPFDVVKIRLQMQQKPASVRVIKQGSCFIYSNGLMDCLCVCSQCSNGHNGQKTVPIQKEWFERPGHFTGTADAFLKITRNEGIAALWSGLPPTLFMAVPATVVYFAVYDRFKYALGYCETDPTTKFIPALAGSSARVLSATVISPLELIRTKMQSQRLTYRQLGEAIRISVESNGLMTLMSGLAPTLLRDVPFSAFYWFGYELLKAQFIKRHQKPDLSFLETFLCGAVSGMVSAIMTLPFDVIKTHRQIEIGEAELTKTKKVTSTWKLIANLYKQNGLSAIFSGIVPRMIKVAPACAIMISSYEMGKQYFRS